MHPTGTVYLGCADCHGGNARISKPLSANPSSAEYNKAKLIAHPEPTQPKIWISSANPVRPFADWLRESKDYIKFVNPGDLRVVQETCGRVGCHVKEAHAVQTSMMTHGAMLWQAALYNNGMYPSKNAQFGESYSANGLPQSIRMLPSPTPNETKDRGILPELDPLLRWETSQPGNVLRVFERGGGPRAEIGNPNTAEDPGRPD